MSGGEVAVLITAIVAAIVSIAGLIAGAWKAFQTMRAKDRAEAEAKALDTLHKEQAAATIKALTENHADLQRRYDVLWSLLEGLTS